MPRKTKREKDQYTHVFCGINRETFEIERVYLDGHDVLHKGGGTHLVMFGRNPESEVRLVWGLSDIVSTPLWLENSESWKRQIADLTAKAAAQKEAAKAG